jgi:hypothetical protein
MILADKRNMRPAIMSLCLVTVLLFLYASIVSAQSDTDNIQYSSSLDRNLARVYEKTQRIRFYIQQLKSKTTLNALGTGEKLPQLVVRVDGVQLHSLYFQALSLKHRSARHSFEQLRVVADYQQSFDASIYPNINSTMVLNLLEQIETELLEVAKLKNFELRELAESTSKLVSSSDVFVGLLSANREFDNLLIQGYQPSDVYQQVIQAINVTIQLLNYFGSELTVQKEPAYLYGKKPSDVWLLLHKNLQILNQIAEKKGHTIFNIDIKDLSAEHILPRDVFQIATTIVSELSFLHHVIGSRTSVIESVMVNNKTPSDVFQKASLLHRQLKMLQKMIPVPAQAGGVTDDASS